MTWLRWMRRAIAVHRGRFVFATVSVVLGVTAYLGVSIGTGTMSQALRIQQGQRSSAIHQGVYLVPTGVWNARAPRPVGEAIARLPGVIDAVPGLGFGLTTPNDAQAYVYGVPERGLAKPSAGRHPADGADELFVGEGVAAQNGWDIGDVVQVPTSSGVVNATIVGTAETGYDVNTSLVTAQRWVGAGDVVEGVYVTVRKGIDSDAWAAEHAQETGVFQRQPYAIFDSDAITFFRQIERSVTPIATAALIMGAFLIYVTISRTVLDRQRDHAALRAVGATRRRVLGLILGEALLVGVIGTAIGLIAGLVVARGVANLMSSVFDVSIAVVPKLNAPMHVIVQGIVLGLAAPLVAAAIPAIRAGREDPAVLLRGDAIEAAPTKRVAVVGALVFVAGLALTVAAPERGKPFGMGVCFVGLVMSGPLLTGVVGAGLQAAAKRVSPLGEMAAQRISRKPGRSARTAALLAATLSMVVILLILGASGRVGFVRLVDKNLAGDVGAWTPSGFTLTPAQVDELRHMGGVTAVTGGAQGAVRVLDRGGHAEFLSAIEPATYFDVGTFAWTRSSSTPTARAALTRGDNVLLATTISQRIHRGVGETVTLQTQRGPHRFRIAGTYAGLATGDTHAVVVSIDDAARWFGYHGVARVRMLTAPGQAPAVAAQLETTTFHLTTALLGVQRQQYVQGFDGAWSLVAVTGVIASAIGLMGLVNTMVMEVVDRRHEIGVLRAVGAHRRDVRRVVSLEALGFGVMAGVVGIVAGSVIGRAAMTGLAHDTEVAQVFRFSPVALPLVTVLALVAGVLAGRVPARRAAAVDPAVVLRSL